MGDSEMVKKPAFTFDVYFSEADGVPVVHVETPPEWDGNPLGPECRIYLNDGDAVYENPPLPVHEYESRS